MEMFYIMERNAAAVLIRECVAADHPVHVKNAGKWLLTDLNDAIARGVGLAKPAKKSQNPRLRTAANVSVKYASGECVVVKTASEVEEITAKPLTNDAPTPIVTPMSAIASSFKPASDRQVAFIHSLIDQKVAVDKREDAHAAVNAKMGTMSTKTASEWIADLLARPSVTVNHVTEQPLPAVTDGVPAGHYALNEGNDEDDDTVVKYYRVDRPTDGKWAGYTFVKRQASDDYFPVKNKTEREAILRAILTDVAGASKLYGQTIGKCGVCNRTLTDEASRAAGVGPVCRDKMGW